MFETLRARLYEKTRSLSPTQNTGPMTCGTCIFWKKRKGYNYVGRCRKRWADRLFDLTRDDTDGCRKWVVHLAKI